MFEFWVFISIVSTLLYVALIGWLYFGINRTSQFQYKNTTPKLSFSIIIAFRDEVENLPNLVTSLSRLAYPNNFFEILLVNDASSDGSVAIVRKFIEKYPEINIQLLNNKRKSISPKKDAINTAIRQSNFDWIITTDADCQVPENWLEAYNAFIVAHKPIFVAGLVKYESKKGFLHQFQLADWMSLTGATIGSFGWNKPLMCSGANLAYNKKAFYKVNAFQGNEHIASGDDVFLLHKIKKAYPNQVSYMNVFGGASVLTKSLSTWRNLYQQRIRWAIKTSSISNKHVKLVGLVVFTMNFLLLILFVMMFVDKSWTILFAVLFLTKVLVDSILIKILSSVIHQKLDTTAWLLSSILYPLFSTSVLIFGVFTKYTWKGRKYSK